MKFPKKVADELLWKSRRYCCLCRKFKGTNIEVHHIDPGLAEGRDDPDNGIPLCFDCHAMVGNYNTKHPRGRKYRPAELKLWRDDWFAAVDAHGLNAAAMLASSDRTSGVEQHVSGVGNIVVGRDYLVNTRKVDRTEFTPGPQHIEEATARTIRGLVDELAKMEKLTRKPASNPHQKWWSKLKQHFHVATYRAIAREQGDEVIAWLQQQKAILRRKLRRTAPTAWREQMYAAIYARAQELGIDKVSLCQIARDRLKLDSLPSSLKDLGEKQLDGLHQIIFSL